MYICGDRQCISFGACLLQLASTSLTHRHFTRISFERCSVCSSLRALCNLLSSFSLRALLSQLLERYTFSCKRVQQVGGSEQLSVSEHHSESTKRFASLHRCNFHADLSQLQEESEQLVDVFMRHNLSGA